MTVEILLIGMFSALICVMLPGWGLKRLLTAGGMRFRDDQVSSLLTAFALGVHINSIIFLTCWTFVDPAHPVQLALAIVAVDVVIGLAGVWFARLPRLTVNTPLILFVGIGIALGIFAAVQFPSTLDSVQIQHLQQYVFGTMGGHVTADNPSTQLGALLLGGLAVPTQPGFGGITLVPALLAWAMPTATTAAANKVLLFVLAAVVSLYAARRFEMHYVLLGATLLLANMMMSKFGLYGLFATGKDSIFSLLMAVASVAALAGEDDDGAANEPGLFMSAAILLGAVAVPYLMVFWALYFVFSGGAVMRSATRQAVWCIYPLAIAIIGVRGIFAEPGARHISLLTALIAGVFAVSVLALVTRLLDGRKFAVKDRYRDLFAGIPLLCVAGIWLVMPVIGHILVDIKDGVPVTVGYPPLDGEMTAADYLMAMYPMNNLWLSVVVVACITLAPLVSKRMRTPFFLALFGFLPATTLVAFLHVKLELNLLPDFNLWDISRDTIQWCMGAFGALLAIVGVGSLLERYPRAATFAVPAVSLVFAIGALDNYRYYAWIYQQSPTNTASGGYANSVAAKAMDLIWREARQGSVYVSQSSPFAADFNFYQMYGAKKLRYFDAEVIGTENEQIFFVSALDMATILQKADAAQYSGFVQALGEDAYAIKLIADTKGGFDTQDFPETIVGFTGTYDTEAAGSVQFRWATQEVKVTLIRTRNRNANYCPTIKFVNSWGYPDLAIEVASGKDKSTVQVPEGASLTAPAEHRVCLDFTAGPTATVSLKANQPARQFPNDSRNIAFGLIWSAE